MEGLTMRMLTLLVVALVLPSEVLAANNRIVEGCVRKLHIS